MTKMQAYKYLQDHGAGFIANVVLCQHKNPARKLRAMATLVQRGHVVTLVSASHVRARSAVVVVVVRMPMTSPINRVDVPNGTALEGRERQRVRNLDASERGDPPIRGSCGRAWRNEVGEFHLVVNDTVIEGAPQSGAEQRREQRVCGPVARQYVGAEVGDARCGAAGEEHANQR